MNTYTAFKHYDDNEKLSRGFHFTIDINGMWYCHDPAMGVGPITRSSIAGLFSGAGSGLFHGKGLRIKKEGGYELFAPPNDIYGVDVEDVPFIITRFENNFLYTQYNEAVRYNSDDFFYRSEGGFPHVPYIMVRDGLMARMGRNVFYELVDLGVIAA